MSALKIRKTIDAETVKAIPELQPFAGKNVELTVLEADTSTATGPHARGLLGMYAQRFSVPDDLWARTA